MAATPYFLSELVPQTGLLADYPHDDAAANRDTPGNVLSVTDYSGNGRGLAPGIGASYPDYVLDGLNGHPVIQFAAENSLLFAGSVTPKHVFIVAQYDLAANFGGTFRGLIGGDTSGDILTGDNGASSTKFTNFANGGDYSYIKSHVAAAGESAQEAPFSYPELLEVSFSSGFTLDGIKLGQQKANSGRRWYGPVGDTKLYSVAKTGNDLRALRLFYDLKYLLWLTAGTTLEFPDPTITNIPYKHFDELPRPWAEITDAYEYEDGGMSFNTRTDNPKREWQLDMRGGLAKAQTDIFDAFWEAVGINRTFSFTDKDGTVWDNVRVVSYSRSHQEHKSWSRDVSFRLCKYPS